MKNITKQQILILIGCMLIQAIPYGLSQNVPPLFIRPIKETFDFSLADVNLMFTIGAVAAAIASPMAGKLYGKFATKIVMLSALVVTGIGMIIQMMASSLEMFYIANSVIQIGCIVFSGLGVPYLIGNWFNKKIRPTAMGIAFSGGSIGNFFLQPIFAKLLQSNEGVVGLRHVFFIVAVSAIVSGVLIIMVFIRDNKEAKNKTDDEDSNIKLSGLGFSFTKKLPAFWLMAFGMLLIGLNIAAQSSQYAVYLESSQIKLNSITGAVGSLFAISCLVGNVIGGVLYSKLGVFKTVIIGFILQIVSCICMLLVGQTLNPMFAFGWALLYGLSVFMYTAGPSVIIQQLFGMKDFGETVGYFNIFFAVGFALGTFIFGAIVDQWGFQIGWISVLIYIVLGYVLMISMIKIIDKEKYDERFVN